MNINGKVKKQKTRRDDCMAKVADDFMTKVIYWKKH